MNFEEKTILKQVKKNDSIVYGAQAIRKQIGVFARPTKDYDILSKNPRGSARMLEKNLDKKFGDKYFHKPAEHPGTHKVKHKGMDNRKNTRDDLEVADFTKPTRRYKTIKIQGVRYVQLSEVTKDKRKSLKSKEFEFRHKKDKEDIERIKFARQFKRKGRIKKWRFSKR